MRARIVSVAVGLWLCAASSFAQQGTGAIGGKVADQGGGVLPGVTIVITNEDTGINREVITGVDGSYNFSQVHPGPYRVSAKLEGFKTLERRGVSVGEVLEHVALASHRHSLRWVSHPSDAQTLSVPALSLLSACWHGAHELRRTRNLGGPPGTVSILRDSPHLQSR